MSPANTDYLVKEIKISGSFKNWTDPARNPNGVSGGSEFEMTVVPDSENPNFHWTPQEAQIVAFDVRMKIHVLLMADAQKRGVKLPAEAHTAILKYREEVEKLRGQAGTERVAWTDSEVAPPGMRDMIESSDDEEGGAYLGGSTSESSMEWPPGGRGGDSPFR
jgi:hypothetical protein